MSKIEEAQIILRELGLPDAQQNEISGYTLLALCNIKENDKWSKAYRESYGISKGIMNFISTNYIMVKTLDSCWDSCPNEETYYPKGMLYAMLKKPTRK